MNGHLTRLGLASRNYFLGHIVHDRVRVPVSSGIILGGNSILRIDNSTHHMGAVTSHVNFVSVRDRIASLLTFYTFFIVKLVVKVVAFRFDAFDFNVKGTTKLLFTKVVLNFVHTGRPAFNCVPRNTLDVIGRFNLVIFVTNINLDTNDNVGGNLNTVNNRVLVTKLVIDLIPIIVYFLFNTCMLQVGHTLLFNTVVNTHAYTPTVRVVDSATHDGVPTLNCTNACTVTGILLALTKAVVIVM